MDWATHAPLRKILDIWEWGPGKWAVLYTLHMFMLFCNLCFKDREAEEDRTDKAEAGPAARTSPAGKEAGMFFILFGTYILLLYLLAFSIGVFSFGCLLSSVWRDRTRAASSTSELTTIHMVCLYDDCLSPPSSWPHDRSPTLCMTYLMHYYWHLFLLCRETVRSPFVCVYFSPNLEYQEVRLIKLQALRVKLSNPPVITYYL